MLCHSTVPLCVVCWGMQIFVPESLSASDSLAKSIDYFAQVELPSLLTFEGAPIGNLTQLRDVIVDMAKAQGRVFPAIPSSEFQLKVSWVG